jgi:membrane protease YdiL (CAAX protease family)
MPEKKNSSCPLFLLALIALLPAIQTCVSVWLEIAPAVTYPLLKVLMIVVPLACWRYWKRDRRQVAEIVGLKRTRCLAGAALGLAMGGAILGLSRLVDVGTLIDASMIRAKMDKLGIIEHYWTMAVFISLMNSLFEEYYWRGFLVGELQRVTRSATLVCAAGGVFFGIHHVFALIWIGQPLLITAAVLGTVIAGFAWTFMRTRGISIVDCWVSHIIADMAVFFVGYEILSGAGQ